MTLKWRVKNTCFTLDLHQQKTVTMNKKSINENLVYQRKLKGYTQEELLRGGVPFDSIRNTFPIIDGDGNEYQYITIGNQKWLSSNLKTTSFNDGSAIPLVELNADWSNAMNNTDKFKSQKINKTYY